MAFKKGQSGNPGGRPKEDAAVKLLAQEHGPDAIAKLAEYMNGEDGRLSIQACTALLDRGFGKPHQSYDVDVNDTRQRAKEELESMLMARGIDPEQLRTGRLDA